MQVICQHDRSLVLEFYWLGYRINKLIALKKIHLFWNLLHVSDIIKCNGHYLDKIVVSDTLEKSVLYTFPREEPTVADYGKKQLIVSVVVQHIYPIGLVYVCDLQHTFPVHGLPMIPLHLYFVPVIPPQWHQTLNVT